MITPDVYRGAQRLLKVCGSLQEGERVAIVTDANKVEFASVMAGQARVLGAEPTLLVQPIREYDGEEPTDLIAAAMRAADLVVMPTTRSLAHSQATRKALEHGARVISIPNVTVDLLSRGGLFADFAAIRPLCRAVADLFTEGDLLHITSPAGTDIQVPISGRGGNAHDCIVDEPGMFTAVPNIEANVAPIEGRAEGRIVFDGSIPNFDIGVLSEPVVLEVRNGKIQTVSGGAQAKRLERIWALHGDENVYNLAQVAIGLNPECRFVSGQLTNDHGVLHTMHFGIGTSRNLGGTVQTSLHMDGILWYPSIWMDGRPIVEHGNLVPNALPPSIALPTSNDGQSAVPGSVSG